MKPIEVPEEPVPGGVAVEADQFSSVQEAINFVRTRGGGIVYTELAGTSNVANLNVPANVKLVRFPTGVEGEEKTSSPKCTVDAELFDSVKDAIDHVAQNGGGVVYTELAGTKYADSLTIPEGVELKPLRERESES